MQRTRRGELLIMSGVGVGCGVMAGLIGVTDWVMAQRKLAADLAAFHAIPVQDPTLIAAGTSIVQGYESFCVTTVPLATTAVLIACGLAAFTMCWLGHSQRDGVVAAWVAAAVGGSMWAVATLVATRTTPVPVLTENFVTLESVLGVLVFGILIPLAPRAARMGLRVRQRVTRGHQAR